jgi:CBS domain-containing protein
MTPSTSSVRGNEGRNLGNAVSGALHIEDVMQYGVVSVDRDDPVYKAIQLLLDKQLSGLPVTHEGHLVGILSEKDILGLLYEQEYLPGRVGDYMSRDIVSFDIEDEFCEVHECLIHSPYRRVPVLREGRLAGIITRGDLIRVYKERYRPGPGLPSSARYRDRLLARDAMTHGILSVRRNASLYDVMDILSARHVTGLPVVDEHMRLEGIITEKDVLRCIDDPQALDSPVQNHMTIEVVAFEQTARLWDVCECLIRHDFRRVPIVSRNTLVGIVARGDIIRMMTSVFKCTKDPAGR